MEAGTGYFKKHSMEVKSQNDMGNVLITRKIIFSKQNGGVSWERFTGSIFEQLDKITPAETPLKLQKKLFLQENTKTQVL